MQPVLLPPVPHRFATVPANTSIASSATDGLSPEWPDRGDDLHHAVATHERFRFDRPRTREVFYLVLHCQGSRDQARQGKFGPFSALFRLFCAEASARALSRLTSRSILPRVNLIRVE